MKTGRYNWISLIWVLNLSLIASQFILTFSNAKSPDQSYFGDQLIVHHGVEHCELPASLHADLSSEECHEHSSNYNSSTPVLIASNTVIPPSLIKRIHRRVLTEPFESTRDKPLLQPPNSPSFS